MSWLWTPHPILTALLVVLAVYCMIRERQTPEYWSWRRDLAAWKGTRRREQQTWHRGRQDRRAARRALSVRHHAMARQYLQVSFWGYLRYLHHAPTQSLPAFNRYVTLAERQLTDLPGVMDQRDHLLSPTQAAPRLPALWDAPGRR